MKILIYESVAYDKKRYTLKDIILYIINIMVNYSNGKIYKLVNNDCSEGNCYYGSTAQPLHKRFHQHKRDYKRWKANKHSFITSYKLFEEDYENVKIVLVEEFKCENKQQLLARERWWIENNNCLNKRIPTRNLKEYYKDNVDKLAKQYKEYYNDNKKAILKKQKEYNIKNKEKIAKQYKEHYEKNKEKIAKQHKEYYEKNKEAFSQKAKKKYLKNKEKIAKQHKEYYEKNKEAILQKAKKKYLKNKEKVKCEFCGCSVIKNNLKRHQRTAKCKSFQNSSI